jgi:hypothetical protein
VPDWFILLQQEMKTKVPRLRSRFPRLMAWMASHRLDKMDNDGSIIALIYQHLELRCVLAAKAAAEAHLMEGEQAELVVGATIHDGFLRRRLPGAEPGAPLLESLLRTYEHAILEDTGLHVRLAEKAWSLDPSFIEPADTQALGSTSPQGAFVDSLRHDADVVVNLQYLDFRFSEELLLQQQQQQQQQQPGPDGAVAVQLAATGSAVRSIKDYFRPVGQQPQREAAVQEAGRASSGPAAVEEAGQAAAATSSVAPGGPSQASSGPSQALASCSCFSEEQHRAGTDCISKLLLLLHMLLAGVIRSLGIQSPMGTGKTTLVKELITALEQMLGRPAKIAIISYRQALSRDMLSNFEELGFRMYLDFKRGGEYFEGSDQLWQCDKVIVQLDSIAMLLDRGTTLYPKYDLVVLDESESLLHHSTAKTLKNRQQMVFSIFQQLLKESRCVLAMDAFLGDETREFMQLVLGAAPPMVRNEHRGTSQHFLFTENVNAWQAEIVAQLNNGKNVVVPCMTRKMAVSLAATIQAACKDLKEGDVLVIHSMADDTVSLRMVQWCCDGLLQACLLAAICHCWCRTFHKLSMGIKLACNMQGHTLQQAHSLIVSAGSSACMPVMHWAPGSWYVSM